MDVVVAVEGPGAGEELRSLCGWLVGEDELRGRVHLKESAPDPGSLGTLPLAVEIALAPGGGVVLASAVVAWLRYRTMDLTFRVTRPDGGAVEASVNRVPDPESARALVAELSDLLREDAAGEAPASES
ncbi:MAG: effector-associated constant component EACC1 [Pseudonocardiaceae bacterium]